MKNVLVVINKLLFGVGLESLLSTEKDLNVKSIPYQNEKTLSEEIQHYKPHVVLVDESIKRTTLPKLLDVLTGLPNIRVLVVNTKENKVQIYDKHEIDIIRSRDLISVVKS